MDYYRLEAVVGENPCLNMYITRRTKRVNFPEVIIHFQYSRTQRPTGEHPNSALAAAKNLPVW